MLRVRIFLYSVLALTLILTLCSGCETSVNSNYTTRWFYTAPHDPYKSRASGPTSERGFTSFFKDEKEDK